MAEREHSQGGIYGKNRGGFPFITGRMGFRSSQNPFRFSITAMYATIDKTLFYAISKFYDAQILFVIITVTIAMEMLRGFPTRK